MKTKSEIKERIESLETRAESVRDKIKEFKNVGGLFTQRELPIYEELLSTYVDSIRELKWVLNEDTE